MSRYTPNDLTGALAPINPELEKIKLAIDDTLSRKNDTPNSMQGNLDMNSQRILNLPEPVGGTEPLRKKDSEIGSLIEYTQRAESAEAGAEQAESDAVTAKNAAQAAQTAAQLAQTNAETAETNAELAETGAEAAQTAAEVAADVAMTAGWVYTTAAAGEADRVDGDYFWVVSADDNEVLELWLMGAVTATDTGKKTPSSVYVKLVQDTKPQAYTEPNLNPDIDLSDTTKYFVGPLASPATLSYVFVDGIKCLLITTGSDTGYAALDVTVSEFNQLLVSASLTVKAADAGSGKRVLLMQYDGSAEIVGVRETVNLTSDAITEDFVVDFSGVTIDPSTDFVRFYIDGGLAADTMTVTSIFIGAGNNSTWRSEKPVLRSEYNALVQADSDNASDITSVRNFQYPNYLGNLVRLPDEFSDIPVTVQQDFYGQSVKLVYDESNPAAESLTKTTYYVDPSAPNGNSGLTPDEPINSLGTLFSSFATTAPTTDIEIILTDGLYNRNRAPMGSTWNYPYNLSITAPTEAIFSSAEPFNILTWTLDSGAYSTTRSAVLNVFDSSLRDYRGIPLWLNKVDTLAECQSTANTWYTNGTSVWVHTFDDREPDSDIIVNLNAGQFVVTVTSGKTFYTENVKYLITGGLNNDAITVSTPFEDTGFFNAINCSFCGSYGSNGLDADNIWTYLRDCTAAYNGLDGFNYHDNISANQAVAIELGCHAYANGTQQTGTNNGSTAHDGMRIIRCNSICYDNYGPNIVDVNGCYSFNINCYAAKSTRPDGVTKSNFYFDNAIAVSDGKAWLVGCGGADSLYDISSDGTAEINVRGWKGTPIVETETQVNVDIY